MADMGSFPHVVTLYLQHCLHSSATQTGLHTILLLANLNEDSNHIIAHLFISNHFASVIHVLHPSLYIFNCLLHCLLHLYILM